MSRLVRLRTPEEKFEAIKLNFRNSDIVEFTGATGKSWESSYSEALIKSDMLWGGLNKEKELVFVGGFIITPTMLVPWFAGSTESTGKDWIKLGKELLDTFKSFNKPMKNYVWIENNKTINWLKKLGFTINTNREYTMYFNIKFYEFYMNNKREEILHV